MRTRHKTIGCFTVLVILSAAYLAVWHLLPPLTRTQVLYAVLYIYLVRPLFWFSAGAVGFWGIKCAVPALDRPISRRMRTVLTVLTILCIGFYILSLCLPPLHLVWVYIPWVYALPGVFTLHLLTAH